MSLKVTDFGTNRKLIYDFLLVINSNFPPILHRFRDIASEKSKIATFSTLLLRTLHHITSHHIEKTEAGQSRASISEK